MRYFTDYTFIVEFQTKLFDDRAKPPLDSPTSARPVQHHDTPADFSQEAATASLSKRPGFLRPSFPCLGPARLSGESRWEDTMVMTRGLLWRLSRPSLRCPAGQQRMIAAGDAM